MLFLALGFLLGERGLGLIHIDVHSPALQTVAILNLCFVLFLDAVSLRFDIPPELEETFARAETLSVMSVDMPVMAVDDVLVNKLLSFEEHYIDFVGLLPIARALREQADWEQVAARTQSSAIAVGFVAMARELGIAPAAAAAVQDVPRIRVSSA